MGRSLTQQIIEQHLVSGRAEAGQEIAIRIDQTLTQDATGTMAYLQFEAMGIPRVKTELSVSYIDHNMLQTGFENADDHRFLQTIAAKYGMYFSRPGNGICHQVHLERFAAPGKTLLGSDSHTPTCGGMGTLAIGAGGLDVAVAMGGGPFHLTMPQIIGVRLTGRLSPWVTAKDIILEMLRRLTVKGGTGKIFEYFGEGVAGLSVPERATITNMGAELGATTSVFPSDGMTRTYLKMQGRESSWRALASERDAAYDQVIELDLTKLEPMVARPQSPDNVCPISEVEGTPVDQVCVGSCTNSSFRDLMTVANILKGRYVNPRVSMTVTPGSRQVLQMVTEAGGLTEMIRAGARIIESACGPCIGMGQAPPTGGVSVRTFNRNFPGRSGTKDDRVFLASPELAAVCAVEGKITDPRKFGVPPAVSFPDQAILDDHLIIPPPADAAGVEVVRGPNIKALPLKEPLADDFGATVLIKLGDNISTDGIMPAGAKVLPLRSNIPAISEFVFSAVDPGFVQRAKEAKSGAIVGGSNYGQGSSREHAALAPMFLGVRMVLAKTFARIHWANLVNFGILPLTFMNEADYEGVQPGDRLQVRGARDMVRQGDTVTLANVTRGTTLVARHGLTHRQREIVLMGGLLNFTKSSGG